MALYLKIILILLGLAYLISPVDIIPDFLLPYIGWIDDGLIIASIIYLIRYGKLPFALFKKKRPNPFQQNESAGFNANQKTRQDRASTFEKNTSSKSIPTPYEILGIDPKASRQEIQSAYREAIKKYHPDKVSHLGEEFSRLASKKFIEIQNAYDYLMKS